MTAKYILKDVQENKKKENDQKKRRKQGKEVEGR